MADPLAPGVTIYDIVGPEGSSEDKFKADNPDFFFNAFVAIPGIKEYPVVTSGSFDFNIESITGLTSTGTVTLSIELDGTPIPGLQSVQLTATEQTFTFSGSPGQNYVPINSRIVVSVEAVGVGEDLELTIACSR